MIARRWLFRNIDQHVSSFVRRAALYGQLMLLLLLFVVENAQFDREIGSPLSPNTEPVFLHSYVKPTG